MFYTALGCGIVVGLAMIKDAHGTVSLIKVIITVRGFTWIVKKITEGMNRDASEVINFTGWSIAGVSIVKLLNNAILGVKPVSDVISKASDSFMKLGVWLDGVVQFADKMIPWD